MEKGAILNIDRSSYHLFAGLVHWRTTGRQEPDPLPPSASVLDELDNPNLRLYVASAEGTPAGWISLLYLPKVGKWNGRGHIYVDELWVAPPFRRRGLARLLLAQAGELAREWDASGIRLYVNTENPAAQSLYASAGFVPSGTACFMEKPV